MIDSLKTYLTYGNVFCGVEHSTLNNKDVIYGVLLKKSKKELVLKQSFEASSYEDLIKEVQKNQHISLVINNDKVVTKIISGQFSDSLMALNKAFPNIDINEFLYEISLQKDTSMVSICRKAYVEELIETYQKNNLHVIDIGLGVSKLLGITRWLQSSVIELSNQQIYLEEGAIIDIKPIETSSDGFITINGMDVKPRYLLACSSGLSSLIQNHSLETNFSDQISLLNNTYKHNRFFKQFFKAGLVFIFGILLINFLVFNHYYNKVSSNSELASFNLAANDKVKRLNEEVIKNKKLYEDVLKNNASKSSFYLSNIAHDLPTSISLNEINYQPLVKRLKDKQDIELNTGSIEIAGVTSEHKAFSEWITLLEKHIWIQKVEIMDFADISKSNSEFQLKITISNES